MCDYSLYEFSNRLAKEREELVVHRFPSGSLGLASSHELRNAEACHASAKGFWRNVRDFFDFSLYTSPVPAVCVPPGARLILKDIPTRAQEELNLSSEEGVTFLETSTAVNRHRDAVRFRNGCVMRLQDLHEGQRVEVLSLDSSEPVREERILHAAP
jgi:hypothetical protein